MESQIRGMDASKLKRMKELESEASQYKRLGDLTPIEYLINHAGNSTFKWST